ncbi:hypothetical protein [Herbaspirillum sp. NPDC087042]|uniref:hypothetical protein n=1 Tax=Herbaspirillum sp. NPDC087042 TaxID=3364004 RepID=UPI00380743B1
MYIVAIAWLYVVFMMSITEQSAVAGVTTFLLYGIFPLTVVLYLMGTPQRKRNRQKKEKLKAAGLRQTEADGLMKSESAEGRASAQGPAHQDVRTGGDHEN